MRPCALQRDLPHLHQSGAIKFLAVLSLARSERATRRRQDASERFPRGSCLIGRFDRVRADMAHVRDRIQEMRAFWSIRNMPAIEMERVRVEAHGHAWFEARHIAVADAALTKANIERGQRLLVVADEIDREAA